MNTLPSFLLHIPPFPLPAPFLPSFPSFPFSPLRFGFSQSVVMWLISSFISLIYPSLSPFLLLFFLPFSFFNPSLFFISYRVLHPFTLTQPVASPLPPLPPYSPPLPTSLSLPPSLPSFPLSLPFPFPLPPSLPPLPSSFLLLHIA